jgi:hypothetical protein
LVVERNFELEGPKFNPPLNPYRFNPEEEVKQPHVMLRLKYQLNIGAIMNRNLNRAVQERRHPDDIRVLGVLGSIHAIAPLLS